MAKCDRQQPNARVRLHSPFSGWRKHVDSTFTIRGDTDFDLFSGIITHAMQSLGYAKHLPFFVGFFLDIINRFPLDVRENIARGIVAGLTTKVDYDQESHEVTVANVPFYPPIFKKEIVPGFVENEDGKLLVPKEAPVAEHPVA